MKAILFVLAALVATTASAAGTKQNIYCGGNKDGYRLEVQVLDSVQASIRYVFPDGTSGGDHFYDTRRGFEDNGLVEFYNREDSVKIDAGLLAGTASTGKVIENPTGQPSDDTVFETCFSL